MEKICDTCANVTCKNDEQLRSCQVFECMDRLYQDLDNYEDFYVEPNFWDDRTISEFI